MHVVAHAYCDNRFSKDQHNNNLRFCSGLRNTKAPTQTVPNSPSGLKKIPDSVICLFFIIAPQFNTTGPVKCGSC